MASVLISFYFSCLFYFSFASHPIGYCLLLLLCCLSGTFFCYSIIGFSWYLIILCLVYVGGVYILFIFVSIHTPNPVPMGSSSFLTFLIVWALFYFLFFGIIGFSVPFLEESHYICSYFEGFSYCLLCLILLLGFVIISVVSSDKSSFYR